MGSVTVGEESVKNEYDDIGGEVLIWNMLVYKKSDEYVNLCRNG